MVEWKITYTQKWSSTMDMNNGESISLQEYLASLSIVGIFVMNFLVRKKSYKI